MTEQELNGADVSARFQQVGSEAVSQGLLILLMICAQRKFGIVVIRSMA